MFSMRYVLNVYEQRREHELWNYIKLDSCRGYDSPLLFVTSFKLIYFSVAQCSNLYEEDVSG